MWTRWCEGSKYVRRGCPDMDLVDCGPWKRRGRNTCQVQEIQNLPTAMGRGSVADDRPISATLGQSQRTLEQATAFIFPGSYPPTPMRNVKPPVEKGVRVGDESSTCLPAALGPSRLGTRGCVGALCQLVSEVAYTNPSFPSPMPGGARPSPSRTCPGFCKFFRFFQNWRLKSVEQGDGQRLLLRGGPGPQWSTSTFGSPRRDGVLLFLFWFRAFAGRRFPGDRRFRVGHFGGRDVGEECFR